jgi:ribosomal protein L21E
MIRENLRTALSR